MADEVLAMEARLKDLVTGKLDVIEKEIKQMADVSKKSFGKADSAASRFMTTLGGFVSAQAIMAGFRRSARAIGEMSSAFLKVNAETEQFTVQFETLLGSTEAARQRIGELAQFAATTPFQLPGLVEANRLLQVFGGTALASEETMLMVGDAAAATSQAFQGVAFWVGRAYTAIQAGRPFGEAAMRLQEMGLLSGKARAEIEQLQAQGATGTEVWAAFTKSFDQFTGAMKRQSVTWDGLMSTIRDNIDQVLRDVGAGGIFDVMKEGLATVVEFFKRNAETIRAWANNVGVFLGAAFATFREVFVNLVRSFGILNSSVDQSEQTMKKFGVVVIGLANGATILVAVIRTLFNVFQMFGRFLAMAFVQILNRIKLGFDAIMLSAQTLGQVIRSVLARDFQAIPEIVKTGLAEAGDIWAEFNSVSAQKWNAMVEGIITDANDIKMSWQAVAGTMTDANTTFFQKFEELLAKLKLSVKDIPKIVAVATDDAGRDMADRLKTFKKGMESVGGQLGAGLGSAIAKGIQGEEVNIKKVLLGALGRLAQLAAAYAIPGIGGLFVGGLAGGVLGSFQHGTRFAPGGRAVVGERGPEVVNVPRGSQVVPTERTTNNVTNNTTQPTVVVVNAADPNVVAMLESSTRDRSIDWPRLLAMGGVKV